MIQGFQIALAAIFAVLLMSSVYAHLRYGVKSEPVVIAVIAGGLILSAVLPLLQEFNIGPNGVTAKLRQLQEDMDALKFLLSGYVTGFELEHLRKMDNPDVFRYERGETFLDELRRLWRHGLIKKSRDDWYLAQLPVSGNLKDYLAITERGRLYLKLLAEADGAARF